MASSHDHQSELSIISKIGESLAAEVFLAKDHHDNSSVVLKRLRPRVLLEGVEEHIEQQLAYLKQQDINALVIPQLRHDKHGLSLSQPFTQAQVLSQWLSQNRDLSITTLLKIGIGLADCLAQRHQRGLIHRGLKPNNILITENPLHLELLDEVRVLDDMLLSQFIQNPLYRRSTLPYIAPELTGRIRINSGFFCDLYALGTVLYECACGRPPFLSSDPLALIHSHLAEEPRPVTELNPRCPAIVADIIATLLHKEPEQRYQSAAGLRADLKTCLQSLSDPTSDRISQGEGPAIIEPFTLRRHEYRLHINTPSSLIGRDLEQRQLLHAYDRVSGGEFGVVMISGLSGIGKTRLIQELEAPIVAHRGYYCAGKFNQFSQHLPYSSLVEAFARLIRQLLSEDEERQQYWRQRLTEKLAANAGLITEFIPELEYIIGPQPPLPALSPTEVRNRFNDTLSNFIACFACEQHPLVLFIDDLQWGDQATFDLFAFFYQRAEDHPYLLLITAYRSNEVNAEHGVCIMQRALATSPKILLHIHLNALEREAINQMVAIMLDTTTQYSSALTDMLYSVSAGNPLYVNESLRWLYQHQRIAPSKQGVWQWDEKSLADLQLPGDARALFAERLKQLPLPAQQLLATAAMLGAHFELNDLDLVSELPPQSLYQQVNLLVNEHTLQQHKGHLHFFHDQLQAAAADFLSAEQKSSSHRKIAQAFIEQQKRDAAALGRPRQTAARNHKKPSNKRLYAIVDHLAAGRRSESTPTALYEEAQFNFRAGVAAMDSLALEASHHYLASSTDLCAQAYSSTELWSRHYDFVFELYRKFARATLMLGHQAQATVIIETALERSKGDVDRATCLLEQAGAAGSAGDMPGAVGIANRALALLGKQLPSAKTQANAQREQLIATLHSEYRDIFGELHTVGDIHGRKACLEMDLYGELLAAYYVTGQSEHLFLTALRIIALSAVSGLADTSCFASAMLAACFQLQGSYQRAASYEDLMSHLVQRFPDSFGAVRALTAAVWLVSHNRASSAELIALCQSSVSGAQRCGEIGFAGHANCPIIYYLLIQGKDLGHLGHEIERIAKFSTHFNLSLSGDVAKAASMALTPLWQSAANDSEAATAKLIETWQSKNNSLPLGCFFIFSGIRAYFNNEKEQARQFLQCAEKHLDSLQNSIIYRLWFVFRYLLQIKNGHNENTTKHLIKVREWADHGPILRPYLALMEAESIAENGDDAALCLAYQEAIDSARQQGYTFLQAFINERLGRYLRDLQQTAADTHLHSAMALYQDCGAVNKVRRLENSLGERRLGRISPAAPESADRRHSGRRKEDPSSEDGRPVVADELFGDYDRQRDVAYLLNSVKAITGELDFNNLLKTIVSAVMGRLGAQTAYLLIREEDTLVPYVSASKTDKINLFFSTESGFSRAKLSMAIAYYVAHSKRRLLLNNALKQGDFNYDDTVISQQLRSVLCLPLVKQQRLLGVLYLENSLITEAFSESQIELSSLLIAQAAVALENARLIAEIRQAVTEVESRERQLRAILDGLSVNAALLTPEGKYLFANKIALLTISVQLDELLGSKLEDGYWWSYSTAVQQELKQDISEAARGQRVRKEYRVRVSGKADTQARFNIIDFSLEPILDGEGEVLFLVLSAVDITHRKRNEEQLKALVEKRSKELEKKQLQLAHAGRLASLGEMATGIAHELGQPLQVIKLAAAILREELVTDSFERAEILPMAEDIFSAVDEASLTLEHMRNFSRPDRTQEISAIDLKRELHNCLVFFQQQFAQQNIQLSLEIDEALEKIAVAGQKFQQIVVNLISNAHFAVEQKHAEAPYQMSVTIRLHAHTDGKRLVLEVEDNGIGMGEATRQRCLEPFFTTKEVGQGTGLGLSIVNTLLQEFHFVLDIQSNLGAGSCFTVFMPIATQASQ